MFILVANKFDLNCQAASGGRKCPLDPPSAPVSQMMIKSLDEYV